MAFFYRQQQQASPSPPAVSANKSLFAAAAFFISQWGVTSEKTRTNTSYLKLSHEMYETNDAKCPKK